MSALTEALAALRSARVDHDRAKAAAAEAWGALRAAEAAAAEAMADAGVQRVTDDDGVSFALARRLSAKLDPAMPIAEVRASLERIGATDLVQERVTVHPSSLSARLRELSRELDAEGADLPDLPGIIVTEWDAVTVRA